MIIILDTGVLSRVTHPKPSTENTKCSNWMKEKLSSGIDFAIPEISDYELRRELIRADKPASIEKLDILKNILEYIPLTTKIMNQAAYFWAESRNNYKQTDVDKALDADMILVAQTKYLENRNENVIVATTNTKHLSDFVNAEEWQNI